MAPTRRCRPWPQFYILWFVNFQRVNRFAQIPGKHIRFALAINKTDAHAGFDGHAGCFHLPRGSHGRRAGFVGLERVADLAIDHS